MRTKVDILSSTEINAKKATGPVDISLIHSLHTLEVLIDIRDCIKYLFDLRHAWDETPKPPN